MTTSTAPAPGEGGYMAGPWKHSADRAPPSVRDPRVWIYAPVGPNHPRIAMVEAVFGVDEEAVQINVANARLIASAPDLLAALIAAEKDLAEEAKSLRDSCSCNGVLDEESADEVARLETLVAQVRAAIAKALSPDLSGGEGSPSVADSAGAGLWPGASESQCKSEGGAS